jgi:hypothetical protein
MFKPECCFVLSLSRLGGNNLLAINLEDKVEVRVCGLSHLI